jgi:large conductance mechanosensitive channel
MKGFLSFIREQGVVGLATGFILGGAISKLVTSLVTDLINPIVGIFLGKVGALSKMYLQIGPARVMWGNFLSNFIDFLIIAMVIYFGVRGLGIHKLDKKKEA